MSRTWHHGDKAKQRKWGMGHYTGRFPAEPTPPKRKRSTLDRWYWMSSTPGWWNNLFHTRPFRRRVQQAIHRQIYRPYEDVVMPVWNKPHNYYW